ncbi:MAG: nitrogen fixation protein fixq [Alphaproteobacteria bacterium]|nr:MAG: nitrogen fixation protein fixq [Alphaproteobacteria bacterium]
MDYDTLRHFADTYWLAFMFILFVGIVAWAFRPGGRKSADEAARIPLKED